VINSPPGGFRDFTRIAAPIPRCGRRVLDQQGRRDGDARTFNEDLSKLTRADPPQRRRSAFEHFSRTRAIRRGIVEIGQDSAAPDLAGRTSI